MTYGPKIKETQHCHQGQLAAGRLGFSPVESVCRAIAARLQVAARCYGTAWAERHQERRHQPSTQNDGRSWMVKPLQSRCSSSGVASVRSAGANPARLADGLQPVRLHAVPAGLRSGKAGRKARELSDHRLHAARHACETTSRIGAGHLETCQKNANGSPATGRSDGSSSRHGTEQLNKWAINSCFVPPRDKTPCFPGWLRPATGHLYRFTICTEVFSGGNQNEKL